MADQPRPQPTSATRPPARSAASTSGIDGRYSWPSGPRNSGRLAPACPSRASAPWRFPAHPATGAEGLLHQVDLLDEADRRAGEGRDVTEVEHVRQRSDV